MAGERKAEETNAFNVALEVQRRAHLEVFKRMELRHQISRAQLFVLGGILAAIALLLERRGGEVEGIIRSGITDVSQLVFALMVMCALIILSSVFYILAASYYAHTMHLYAASYFERKVIFDVLARLLRDTDEISVSDATALFSWEALLKRVRNKSGLNDYHAEEQLGFSVPFFLNMCSVLVFVVIVWSVATGGTVLWDQLVRVPLVVTVVLTLSGSWAAVRCFRFYWRAADARVAVTRLRDVDMISDRDLQKANEVLDKILIADASQRPGIGSLLRSLISGLRRDETPNAAAA